MKTNKKNRKASQKTLAKVFIGQSKKFGPKVAYKFINKKIISEITYEELDQKAKSYACQLAALGLSGKKLVLAFPHGIEFIIAFFACLYAGIVAVPVFPVQTKREQHWKRFENIVTDCHPAAIITNAQIKQSIISNIQSSINIILLESLSDHISQLWQKPKVYDSTAFIQYTSGSTGDPKGVVISHENLIHNLTMLQRDFHVTAKDTFVSWLPFYHDMGLIGNILLSYFSGSTVTLLAPVEFIQRPLVWLETIHDYQATISGGPNFAYDLCAAKISEEDKKNLDLSSWRIAFNGSEPVSVNTIKNFYSQFKECQLSNNSFYTCYGLAESTLYVVGNKLQFPIKTLDISRNIITNEKNKKLVSSGKLNKYLKVVIVNPKDKSPVVDGEEGEIWVHGYSVAQGYFNKADLTEETFHAFTKDSDGPYLRTGDMGIVSENNVYVTGRCKEIVVMYGRNFYPADLEKCIQKNHDNFVLHGGSTFSVNIDGVEKLIVIQEITRGAIREKNYNSLISTICQSIVDEFGISPHEIFLVKPATIEKTSSGKIKRRLMREKFRQKQIDCIYRWCINGDVNIQSVVSNNQQSAQENSKEGVVNILAEEFGISIKNIDGDVALANYGLDSIKAVHISHKLSQLFHFEFSETLLFDYPTLNLLHNFILGNQKKKSPQIHYNFKEEESIAIVGMACQFPNANNVDEFWEILVANEDATSALSHTRKMLNGELKLEKAGFLSHIGFFDADFFDISEREANHMDPQQRILLETSYHALENAGITLSKIAGSNTGVYVGISNNEYGYLQMKHDEVPPLYSATGGSMSVSANRLSYFYDTHGPSYSIDTACSSSLSAVHLASQSLLSHEINLAIVGGVNLILNSSLNVSLFNAGMLSKDYQCKTFDNAADGYVRGEGCGVVILKRLSDAINDNDNILAVIKGSACNQDGRSNGLTAPNTHAQQAVMKKCLAKSQINASEIGYIEAHGSATKLGDTIEFNSIRAVYQNSMPGNKCYLGSVKTNIGHLEAAAGLAGLIKIVLTLRSKLIPANLNFNELNKNLKINDTRFEIPSQNQAWDYTEKSRKAAISSFGFGGTNVHMVLEEYLPKTEKNPLSDLSCYILPISAKCKKSLLEKCKLYHACFKNMNPEKLYDICYSAAVAQNHFKYRCVFVGNDLVDICNQISNFINTPQLQLNENNSETSIIIPSLNKKMDSEELKANLLNISLMYMRGDNIDWLRLYSGVEGEKVFLPLYPLNKKLYWFKEPEDQLGVYQQVWKEDSSIKEGNTKQYGIENCKILLIVKESNLEDVKKIFKHDIKAYIVISDTPVKKHASESYLYIPGNNPLYKKRLSDFINKVNLEFTHIVAYYSPAKASAGQDLKNNDSVFSNEIKNILYFLDILNTNLVDLHNQLQCCFIIEKSAQDESLMHINFGIWQGLVKTLDLEQRNHKVKYVEINKNSPINLDELRKEVLYGTERVTKYIGQRKQMHRLHSNSLHGHKKLNFNENKCYVITGGLGSLGLYAANWLVQEGAKHIILVSRSGICAADSQELFADLQASSVEISILKGSIAEKNTITSLKEHIMHSGKSLAGIIHAAGITGNPCAIDQLDPDELFSVCSGKLQGVINLAEGLDLNQIDFLLLFSSIAGAWGGASIGAYSAANAGLDSYAEYARIQGVPVWSIAWGPWATSGMSNQEVLLAQLKLMGIKSHDPVLALETMKSILTQSPGNYVVANMDLGQFSQIYGFSGNIDFLSDLNIQKYESDTNNFEPELIGRVSNNPLFIYSKKDLHEIIVNLVKEILGKDYSEVDYSQGFFAMGFDSLMLVELNEKLRKIIKIHLPIETMFNYGSVEKLAEYIFQKIQENSSQEEKNTPETARRFQEINVMSDEDALYELAKQVDGNI